MMEDERVQSRRGLARPAGHEFDAVSVFRAGYVFQLVTAKALAMVGDIAVVHALRRRNDDRLFRKLVATTGKLPDHRTLRSKHVRPRLGARDLPLDHRAERLWLAYRW